MTNNHNRVYLFVHVIWMVKDRVPLLSKPVRSVLFAQIQKHAIEHGINMKAVNGVADHIHCLVQMLPSQNLLQIITFVKEAAAGWMNDNKLMTEHLEWEAGFAAYSVSPSGLKQVADYINRQEEHHKNKTLENELEVFDKMQL